MVEDIQQEGRLILAIKSIESNLKNSVRKIARLYDVPRTTLQERLKKGHQHDNSYRTTHKLTKTEENVLVQWIISLDTRGAPPRPSIVRDIANILLSQRNSSQIPLTVGKNWIYKFLQRHIELKSRFNRKYNS